MAEYKVYYECNPEANKQCSKANCFECGGPCKHTTNVQYALDPDKAILVVPMTHDEARELGLMEEEDEQ